MADQLIATILALAIYEGLKCWVAWIYQIVSELDRWHK